MAKNKSEIKVNEVGLVYVVFKPNEDTTDAEELVSLQDLCVFIGNIAEARDPEFRKNEWESVAGIFPMSDKKRAEHFAETLIKLHKEGKTYSYLDEKTTI